MEQTIRGLKNVRSARVISDSKGGILEVHVVSDSERAPKQISRDVESMLVAKLGVAVDYRKISVAQVDGEVGDEGAEFVRVVEVPELDDGADVVRSEGARVRFIGVSVAQSELMADAKVEVALGSVTTAAAVSGADSTDSVLRLIAEATLEAVQRFFEGGGLFSISSIEQTTIGGRSIIVVNVAHLAERHERLLVGACPVNGDVPKAAALATLDAVNRFLGRLSLKEPTEYEIGPASES